VILLTIAGQEVRMVRFKKRMDGVIGEAVRSLANTLLDGTSATARAWEGESLPMLPEDVATLESAIADGPVVCVIREEEVLCKVTAESAEVGPDVSGNVADWSEFNDTLNLLLREV